MCFFPLQQDFYSKSRHAFPQNSSQIYAYASYGEVYGGGGGAGGLSL